MSATDLKDEQIIAVQATPDHVVRTGETPRRRFLRRFLGQPAAVAAFAFLLLLVLAAIAAPWLAPHDAHEQDLRAAFQSFSGEHLLGTDELGRDLLSRLLVAARSSLLAAGEAVAISFLVGVPLGLVAGYVGGLFDTVVMRITDAVMSFPPLLLAITVVAVLGPGLVNAMAAVGIVSAPRFLRLARGSTLAVREETYVEAARSIGTPTARIIRRHVLPNVWSPLIVQVSLTAGYAMLAEASLSFLGLGVQSPDFSWGSMLDRAADHIGRSPLLVVVPGVAIALTVLAFNVLGDGIRDSIGRETRES